MTSTNPAQAERAALSDLFVEVGPDAATLCGDWTTRDLAAHLVMRERRPDGALGIVVSKAAGHADKVQAGIAERDWSDLVETVRHGPPKWSPMRIGAVDQLANTVEFFVHHEDVRRAAGAWTPRELDPVLADALYGVLQKFAKRLLRSSDVGIVLEPTSDHDPIVGVDTDPSVTVRGAVGDLVLFAYGRQHHSRVELFGDDASTATVMEASFGL